jgi:hypothetical protein
MSIGAVVAVVIAAIIVVAAVTLAIAEMRRRALIQRFGPEYERLASERGARRAGAELTARQRLLAKLNIRPLTDGERESYARRWNGVQEQFVDDPTQSVNAASSLLTAVLKDRGYPADNGDETLRALSVEHAQALQEYRRAQKLTGDENGVSTEDLRQALLGYRRLFRELTGSGNGQATASSVASAPTPAPAPAWAPASAPVPAAAAPVWAPASAPVPAATPVPFPARASVPAPASAPAPDSAPVPASDPVPDSAPDSAAAQAPDPIPVPVPFPASVRARMARMRSGSTSADDTAADDAGREADPADR